MSVCGGYTDTYRPYFASQQAVNRSVPVPAECYGARWGVCENSTYVIVIDGIYYALGLGVAGALIAWLTNPGIRRPAVAVGPFCLYFFRDPDRAIPDGPVAVSPADGKVVAVKAEGPALQRISIFLNVFDVHVNRTPIGGTICKVQYQKGQFHVASREECSTQNEQNVVTVQGDGTSVVFKQIAGTDRAPDRLQQEGGR